MACARGGSPRPLVLLPADRPLVRISSLHRFWTKPVSWPTDEEHLQGWNAPLGFEGCPSLRRRQIAAAAAKAACRVCTDAGGSGLGGGQLKALCNTAGTSSRSKDPRA